jgi:hypothetical protein
VNTACFEKKIIFDSDYFEIGLWVLLMKLALWDFKIWIQDYENFEIRDSAYI